uniref:Uncharacterized protein n=1 Tax=Pristionchus pacificus TaxID=54126 RepID=A0A2A6CV75_PRIPA|eukprot:PDM81986.1 hypothetical protein PRIPAC_33059 [Pristionchus pacificus]
MSPNCTCSDAAKLLAMENAAGRRGAVARQSVKRTSSLLSSLAIGRYSFGEDCQMEGAKKESGDWNGTSVFLGQPTSFITILSLEAKLWQHLYMYLSHLFRIL